MHLLNLEQEETIHQRCVLVKGRCESKSATYVTVKTSDPFGYKVFPEQTWPVAEGEFRALIFLVGGKNMLNFTTDTEETTEISISYMALTSLPPVHLAILVCKDSPMMMDCSPARGAGISTAHSNLDAAIAKLRMTAYMWMALTAEEMRLKGFGRRSFRLEEEWTADTISSSHVNPRIEDVLHAGLMQTTAKVHILRSEKTVDEMMRPGYDVLNYFDWAIAKYGLPLLPNARPVIACMVLDSHYSHEKEEVIPHSVRRGLCQRTLRSVGHFGSEKAHAFPSYVEEVISCLRDARHPGPSVGCKKEDDAMWKLCAEGQMSLKYLAQAFGADEHFEPMDVWSSYKASDWASVFLPPALVLPDQRGTDSGEKRDKTGYREFFSFRQALRLHVHPSFRLPHEKVLQQEALDTKPTIRLDADSETGNARISIECSAGVCQVIFRDSTIEATPTKNQPLRKISMSIEELTDRFTRKVQLKIEAIAMNGHNVIVEDAWKLIDLVDFIKIPGTSVKLWRCSVASREYLASKRQYAEGHGRNSQNIPNRNNDFSRYYRWNVLLSKRLQNGTIVRASRIMIHVGACFDGAVVKYANNEEINCAPRFEEGGEPFEVGGTRNICKLDKTDEVAQVEVARGYDGLGGVRIVTAHGHRGGRAHRHNMETLKPPAGYKIIGLYGAWLAPYHTHEFGIIAAPRDFELPPEAYDLPDLNNLDPYDPNRPGASEERNGQHGVQPEGENYESDIGHNSGTEDMDSGLEDDDEDEDEDMGSDDDSDGEDGGDSDHGSYGEDYNGNEENPYIDPTRPADGNVENVQCENGQPE